jgi:hypothetical protein
MDFASEADEAKQRMSVKVVQNKFMIGTYFFEMSA